VILDAFSQAGASEKLEDAFRRWSRARERVLQLAIEVPVEEVRTLAAEVDKAVTTSLNRGASVIRASSGDRNTSNVYQWAQESYDEAKRLTGELVERIRGYE
jgi:hypothetical protein